MGFTPPIRRSRKPPFCPRAECISHSESAPWRYKKKGFYLRKTAPRRIQRYLCSQCGRNFSSQTFSTSYWLRRPELLRPVFLRILSCSALRQIAQEYRVSHTTILRLVERLGRHCLLVHEKLRPSIPREILVLDGFRSFEFGQYWPFDLNLVVGSSHYVYGFQDAELPRSGSMRPAQRRKWLALQAAHGRPDPRATERSVGELLDRLVPPGASLHLRSDRHPAYSRALKALGDREIEHRRTSSRVARTPQNPLFPVNLADLLLRHTGANHKRETIAFSKRRQGALYRAAIFTVWRNYLKSSSERLRDAPPGVRVGAVTRRLRPEEVLGERLFVWQWGLGGWLERCYFGRIRTRRLAGCRSHELRYAI